MQLVKPLANGNASIFMHTYVRQNVLFDGILPSRSSGTIAHASRSEA